MTDGSNSPRLVLAGCAALPAGDGDDDGLLAALAERGLSAQWLAWDDPATASADVVILRATWDYIDRLDEFLAWTTGVPRLLNAPAVVAWNTDKRYLADLAADGVPVVPSVFVAPGEQVELPVGEVVVKPAVGAGSVGALRFDDGVAAAEHAATLHAAGQTALIQPYDPRIDEGETALVFLRGEPSHAFTKGPILPPPGGAPAFDESGTFATERLAPVEPAAELWDLGHLALRAAAAHLALDVGDLLYARVDVIGAATDAVVLELELVEPSLGWRQLAEPARRVQQRRFAAAVEALLTPHT